ncbi:MAG TPA: hypothetical protein VFD36_23055 [Kofleriaceae bacterium]|nr:hypothetical protein [Kofleriaceae bacterium]
MSARKLTWEERAALLRPQYMTPEQVADLVARARANTAPHRIESGHRMRARWDAWRADRGR